MAIRPKNRLLILVPRINNALTAFYSLEIWHARLRTRYPVPLTARQRRRVK